MACVVSQRKYKNCREGNNCGKGKRDDITTGVCFLQAGIGQFIQRNNVMRFVVVMMGTHAGVIAMISRMGGGQSVR